MHAAEKLNLSIQHSLALLLNNIISSRVALQSEPAPAPKQVEPALGLHAFHIVVHEGTVNVARGWLGHRGRRRGNLAKRKLLNGSLAAVRAGDL